MHILYVLLTAVVTAAIAAFFLSLETWIFNIISILVILAGISVGLIVTAPDRPESGE